MNKSPFAFCLLALLALACEKTDTTSPGERALQGEWILNQVSGGIHGQGYEAAFDRIRFDDGSYELLDGERMLSKGFFQYNPDAQFQLRFLPQLKNPETAVFEEEQKAVRFSGDQDSGLRLADPCCDRWEYGFVREEE